jgi:4-amino-4-deoxy-L-arabinose transferase-like glycosyltransferase
MSGVQRRWRFWALALALLLLAFGLRTYRLPAQSLWYDEALSVHYAAQPLGQMLSGVSGSDHPPLHALLLHLWMQIAGRGEFSVRYLSVWWGVLSVALLYRLGDRFFDRPTGLLAAALLAVSPFHVWYSQEARMYSLALALCLGLALALLAIVSRREATAWPWVGYVLTGALALYAHFYTAFVLLFANAAFGVWWLARLRRAGRPGAWRILARWTVAQAMILGLFAPWGRFVAEQYATNATYWHGALGVWQILRDTTLAFATGDRLPTASLAQAGALALLALALFGLLASLRRPKTSEQGALPRGVRALWLLLWLAVPVIALFAISHDRPKFAPRYLLIALPALLLAAGAGGARLAVLGTRGEGSSVGPVGRWAAALGLALAAGLTLTSAGSSLRAQYLDSSLARPDFRAVGAYVADHARPRDVVVLVGGHSYPAFDYYFDRRLPVRPLPPGLLPTTRAPLDYLATAQLAEIAAGRDRLWLVLWQDRLADPTEVVLSYLLLSCPRLEVGRSFHDLALLLFSVADCELATRSEPEVAFRAEFGGEISLLGYDLSSASVAPGEPLYLTLYWQAMGEVTDNYTTFAQVVGPDGTIVAQHDRVTGADVYPTQRWQPEAVIRNEHVMRVAPDAPAGKYRLIVGLYHRQGGLVRLPVTFPDHATDDAVLLSEIEISKQR